MTGKWLCLPVALCVLSSGCGGKKPEPVDKGTPAATRPTSPEAASPTPAADAPKGAFISKFKLGSSFGPDGSVFLESHLFTPGETVGTSFEIPNAASGSKVRVAWTLLPDKRVLAHQEAPLSPDKPALTFKGDSKGWPLGEYELLITLVDPGKEDAHPMGNATFKLVKDKPK
jgi:hypothetical protein